MKLGCRQGHWETEGSKWHFNKERTRLQQDAGLRAHSHLPILQAHLRGLSHKHEHDMLLLG